MIQRCYQDAESYLLTHMRIQYIWVSRREGFYSNKKDAGNTEEIFPVPISQIRGSDTYRV